MLCLNGEEAASTEIVETPLCKHGKPSRIVRVKKEDPNNDRCFFSCNERKGDRCKFFKWLYGPDTEDPFLPGTICGLSKPRSYKYILKKNGAVFTSSHSNREKAYEELVKNGEKTDPPEATPFSLIRAAAGLPFHDDNDDDDDNPEKVNLRKKKTKDPNDITDWFLGKAAKMMKPQHPDLFLVEWWENDTA